MVFMTPELAARAQTPRGGLPAHRLDVAESGPSSSAAIPPHPHPPQAAAQAGPPAATVRRETAALPGRPVGATDLRGASRHIQEGAERSVCPLPAPRGLPALAWDPCEVSALGVVEIWKSCRALVSEEPPARPGVPN